MAGERGWIDDLTQRLGGEFASRAMTQRCLRVEAGARLAYAHEVRGYDRAGEPSVRARKYQTDLLVSEHRADGTWTPRLVIEGKLGRVTTHDALTYSAKASSHKAIHPHMRYGILVGALGDRVPGRLMRHGAHFDFMAAWKGDKPSVREWTVFFEVVMDEVRASRQLESDVLASDRSRGKWQMLHRRLELRSTNGSVLDAPPVDSGRRA
jgi:hypothetical protein